MSRVLSSRHVAPVTSANGHSETGQRIKGLRLRAGLSQEKFAPLVGITRRHLIRLENGENRPGRDLAARMEGLVEEVTGEPVPFRILEVDAPFHDGGS